MNNLTIVPLNKKYTCSFFYTINEILSESCEDSFSYMEILDFINNRLKYNIPFLLLINENKVVGWCHIQPKDNVTGVLGMGILKEYRNKGYGKILMSKTINLCYEKGYLFIECQIKSHNTAAINLSNTFGFSEYNRIPNFNNKDNIIEMVLNLNKAKA